MGINELLYDWQKDIVNSLASKKSYGIWLDMGLGKTPLSLALCERHKCDRIIIITINAKATESKSVSGSWLNWSHKIGPITPLTKKSKLEEFNIEGSSVFLINYESLFVRNTGNKVELKPNVNAFIESCRGRRVGIIVDESHKMKDLQSHQTKAIDLIQKKIARIAKDLHTYLLTGTPFTTGFIDLYSQLKFLGCPITKQWFKDNFCVIGNVYGLLGWQQPIVGYKNLKTLYQLIHQYAITIKSDEVLKLPEQIFQHEIIPTNKYVNFLTTKKLSGRKILKENEDRAKKNLPVLTDLDLLVNYQTTERLPNPWYRNIDYPHFDYMCDTPGSLWLRTRQLSIGFQGNAEKDTWYDYERLNVVKRFLGQNQGNYILFYNYTPELIKLYEICEALGYNIDIYSGQMKSLFYYERYSEQSEEEQVVNNNNIILANWASGSTGKNWQLYNKCIIFSLPLYKDWEQGLKRIHRIGQNKTTYYYIFRSDNWLDDSMWKALEEGVEYSVDMFTKELNSDPNK